MGHILSLIHKRLTLGFLGAGQTGATRGSNSLFGRHGMVYSGVRRLLTVTSLVFIGALFSCVASAQIVTGLHGLVKDSSGAVVPKASLQLVDMATNVAR